MRSWPRSAPKKYWRKSGRLKSRYPLSISPTSTPIISWGWTSSLGRIRGSGSLPHPRWWTGSTKCHREKLDKWQKILGSRASSTAVCIRKFDAGYLDFDGARIQLINDIQGDTDQNTMLWIPGQRVLIAGDVLFDDIHVYTGETDSNARAKWLDTLRKVRELRPSVVVPGHSKVGAALDASTAVDFTERYLLAFNEELKTAKDPEGLINAMKQKFPSAGLLLALERGAKANVKP